jgi:Domain of unknown function (DUF1830)
MAGRRRVITAVMVVMVTAAGIEAMLPYLAITFHKGVQPSPNNMSQILDPVPSDRSDPIFCCYTNNSGQVQIVRITNIDNWYFERVAFPGQRLIFEAPMNAYLEIHTGKMTSSILSDRIPCIRLRVDDLESGSWESNLLNNPPAEANLTMPKLEYQN